MSSALPCLPRGILLNIFVFASSDRFTSGHSIDPGAMPLTLTSGASSFAKLSVSVESPALAIL